MTMFIKARLKLTAWYLVILMTVSMSFSLVIYRASVFELSKFAQAQRQRFEHRPLMEEILSDELFIETKNRIALNLLVLNLGILGVSAILGYYLSGKTLSPIQEMVEEQKRFISDASHELKTPITAIKTTLEVAMRDKNLQIKEAKSTLSDSLEEVNKLQSLTEGLLELSYKNSTQMREVTEISELIEKAIKTVLPIAELNNIEIKNGKIPKYMILVEPKTMERAVVAILDNAIKYSHTGDQVEITLKKEDKNILIAIKDHGIGIEKNDLEQVFERFYRSDKSRHSQGYGLGLSIAKKIIQNNEGQIRIESRVNKGTSVYISLPYSAKLQQAKRK